MVTNTGIGVGIGIPFRNNAHGGDKPYLPPEIKDSLKAIVIAYGKSNDDADRSIVKNLVDASNPFIISNAAFKLNSGFGEYEQDFTDWKKSPKVTSFDSESIKFTSDVSWVLLYHPSSIGEDIPSFKVRVKLYGKGTLYYSYITQEGKYTNVAVKSDIFETPICYNTKYTGEKGVNVGFTLSVTSGECSGTITQIPSFEGAFVTDGIDDLITSTKTVQEMGITDEVTVVSMIHQIDLNSTYTIATTNYIENSNSREHVRSDVYNYGKTGIYGYSASLINNTKSDIKNILGDEADYYVKSTNSLQTIFDAKFSVVGRISELTEASQVAWYWTIIANKVLTTDEINQVIAYYNLDRTLKPDILCNTIKQGITNENHAEFGDKLIDFSGNGRDIQLNNIAWKGDSGIGKYETDFLDSSIWKYKTNSSVTSDKIVCNKAATHIMLLYYSITDENKYDVPSFNVLKQGDASEYYYIDEQGIRRTFKLLDGINTLPASHGTLFTGIEETCGFGNPGIGDSVTITQIPSHAGGLCLDGVNDFGKVTGMPIYKDYTIVVDYERISGIEQAWAEALISKSYIANQGAFVLMETNGTAKHSYSFGAYTIFNKDDSTRTLLYQSKYKCGDVGLNAGTGVDGDTLWLGTYRDNYSSFFNGAIYSLMSFPYSMSEFLIERQLKKHKLGTLYPNMVEFRPVIKANANYKITYYQIDSTNTWKSIKVGDYIVIGAKLAFQITFDNDASELKEVVSPQLSGIIVEKRPSNPGYNIYSYITSKSPQKINITIDEYIRYEDIVQPYPSLFTLIDCDTEEVYSWGSKLKVGARFKGNVVNLLPNMYEWQGDVLYNGEVLNWGINPGVVAKEMVFSWNMPFKYLIDNNEPKCILSPRLLRIPNSSYKLLGYIPDISGHGNHGVIHNSAYAEGSGVNEDGSYQFDGVDDFVTIPTTVGGKQVLMKVNWQKSPTLLYDQRASGSFAVITTKENDAVNSRIAYQARNQNGKTYIDGIENNNIETYTLKDITHNITIANSSSGSTVVPAIGCNTGTTSSFAQMSLYDFMLFDNISTDDKILELNEYVGIEAKVELPPYYWDAYGKSNLDEDRDSIKQRGVAVGDYDLTNYNHAYDKMSGYGGYEFAKFDNTIEWFAEDSSMVVNRNGYLITLKKVPNVAFWKFRNTTLKSLDNPLTFKVKCNKPIDVIFQVKFAKNNDVSIGYDYNIKEVTLVPNESTTIIVPSVSVSDIPEATSILFINVLFDNTSLSDNEEYTVEMLPLYPNGLLYDAVTDYSENVNIPVFTDFTAIMKRKWLKNQGCPLIKGSKVYEGGNGNALLLEWDKAYNFVFYKRTDIMEGELPDNISFITPTNYNGNVITRGSEQDTNGICIAGDGNAGFANMVFYKLILYPKTIPLLQINFLKNLMERDEIIDLTNPIFIKNE